MRLLKPGRNEDEEEEDEDDEEEEEIYSTHHSLQLNFRLLPSGIAMPSLLQPGTGREDRCIEGQVHGGTGALRDRCIEGQVRLTLVNHSVSNLDSIPRAKEEIKWVLMDVLFRFMVATGE